MLYLATKSKLLEKSSQPSHAQVQYVLQQLHEIPCTLRFRLNAGSNFVLVD